MRVDLDHSELIARQFSPYVIGDLRKHFPDPHHILEQTSLRFQSNNRNVNGAVGQETTGSIFFILSTTAKNCLASSSANHSLLDRRREKALQGKPAIYNATWGKAGWSNLDLWSSHSKSGLALELPRLSVVDVIEEPRGKDFALRFEIENNWVSGSLFGKFFWMKLWGPVALSQLDLGINQTETTSPEHLM